MDHLDANAWSVALFNQFIMFYAILNGTTTTCNERIGFYMDETYCYETYNQINVM